MTVVDSPLADALRDRYLLERELGRGGMAAVYLARDLKHGRLVALKVLHAELAGALGADRFLREIKLAAGLSHPNILPLYDSGTLALADGVPGLYYAMEFVDGESVRSRLTRERQLSVEDALRIASDVAAALAYAHKQGVIHRDIKPENILLSGYRGALGDWRVFLADFGIAKAVEAAGAERLTETGLALGTPTYMSPEQGSGEHNLDQRSDLYALGCVLYEMLAGQPPFTGVTARAVLARHALDPVPSLRSVRPTVPESLERILTRVLAKVPADRFATATEFGQALAEGATARRPRPRLLPRLKTRRSVRLAVLGGVALAALSVLGVLLFRGHPTSAVNTDPSLVVVLPFRVTDADSSLKYLRDGMPDLLAVKLTGEGGPRAVDPRAVFNRWRRVAASPDDNLDLTRAVGIAKSFGAGRLVDGSIVGTASHLILTASVIAVPAGGTLTRASVAGPADNLPLLVDRLTAQALAGEAGRTDLATLTSLPAIRAYLDGKAALRAGHFDDALKSFDHSLNIDSTFALAALEVQEASGWASGWLPQDYGARGVLLAWPVRDRLSPRDRALLLAHAGPRFPAPSSTAEFLEAAEQAVAAAPERPEAWYKLGDEYFHWGALLSLPHPLGQAAAGLRRGQELDSAAGRKPDAGPLEHVFDIAAIEGDTASVRRLGSAALADPDNESADYVRWQMAYVLGDSVALSALRARFDRMNIASLTDITLRSQETGFAPDDARRAVKALLSTAKTHDERQWALSQLKLLAFNGGRPGEALAATRRQGRDAEQVLILATLFWDGDSSAALRVLRTSAETADGPLARSSRGAAERSGDICITEQWRLAHGEFGNVPSAITRLRGAVPVGLSVHDSSNVAEEAQVCAALLEAWLASAARHSDAPRHVNRLDSLSRKSPAGWNEAWNLVVARLLEAQGDVPRALAAVRRRVYGMVPRYLSTYLREEGRLAALGGDRAGAIRAYQHYLALRWDPEPSLRPEVDRVRAELAELVGEPR